MPSTMNITIFSRGPTLYSTTRLVEAARGRGHVPTVVDHAFCGMSLMGTSATIRYKGEDLPRPDVVIPRIGSNITVRGAALIRQLDVMKVPHTMPAEALLLARDKMGSLQLLAGAGIPVPRTSLCFSVHEARALALREKTFPVVVKLLESTHGVGVALAASLNQLTRTVEGFLTLQDRILIQEYIQESKGRDVRALVVGDRVVAAMERKATAGEFRANMHRGATARPIDLNAEDRDLCIRAARALGVEVAGVDLIPSHRGYLLMEVNASPGLEGIETTTGVDVAGAIIEYAASKVPS